MLRRKIYEKLKEWKEVSNGKSALLIEGARRVGKSTVAEEFAKNEYDDYIVLDFALESDEIRNNFANLSKPDVFFRNLFLLKGKDLPVRRSLIIFDEVQLFPAARQAIKYLVKDGRYDYLETGSLISIRRNVQNIVIPSEEEKIQMFPMDFEEFLWAGGDTVTADAIRDAFESKTPLGDTIHRTIMNRYRTYLACGGMPQAVQAFVDGATWREIDRIKKGILDLYDNDLVKYDQDDRERASVIFRTIPEQLMNHNSHFKWSVVDKNARFQNYVDAVGFLSDSMIVNECIDVTQPEVTLEAYADRSNFKLYMGDTGLLVTQMMKGSWDPEEPDSENLYRSLLFGKLGINLGMVMENSVAQALRMNGHALYFHEFDYQAPGSTKENHYEIDFLIVRKQKVCPLEVKSSQYRRHASFDYFVQKYPIKVEDRYILYTKDYHREDGITCIPLYMAMCL
ncbi:MAG: AAA family ATPase [Lachnospiraceae bacterium]|jgi:predicted AAA+ superfamily ATPase